MAGAEEGEVGFEEVMLWLPSHVLDEAICDHTKTKEYVKQRQHRQRPRLWPEPLPLHLKANSRQTQNHRAKNPNNGSFGGPGMQAIFLDSGEKSCGTGVFLPRRACANFQSSKKPACSPVLLPSRVVQALNLNVHALGLQISPRQDAKYNNTNGGDSNNSAVKINKSGKDVSTKCCVMSHNQSPPPEIFLPKEWTY